MKKMIACLPFFLVINALASNIIPLGNEDNMLYYKIGGGRDFALPPVSDVTTIRLNTNSQLGLGYTCSAFNPALSIANSLNDIKDSFNNLTQDIIINATASLIMMPMYELAKSNPTLYALLNGQLLSANQKLAISTKSCETVRENISRGENPYHDWGTIAVNDQWKQKISFAANNDADINQAKKDIDAHSGDEGVTWVNGNQDHAGNLHAGGKNQPSVHVISDTVLAGYNTLLNRDLQSKAPADANSSLAHYFSTPQAAIDWITNVVGDQTITTCNSDDCKRKQGNTVGHGLTSMLTSCQLDQLNCSETIRNHLSQLITGNESINKDNLENVSADGIAMTPDAIRSIRNMNITEQSMIVGKLSEEIAMQRIIDKALIAKNILATGAQVPVISANNPAQKVIHQAINNLENDIRSLVFESQIRKQMMSDTLSQVFNYSNQAQNRALETHVTSNAPLMENGAKKDRP